VDNEEKKKPLGAAVTSDRKGSYTGEQSTPTEPGSEQESMISRGATLLELVDLDHAKGKNDQGDKRTKSKTERQKKMDHLVLVGLTKSSNTIP